MNNAAKRSGGAGWLANAWTWFSQIVSIIGLIGLVEDLKLWARAAAWCMARLSEAAPAVAAFFASFGACVHAVLEFLRGLYRPAFEALFSWLPFDVPVLVTDVALVAIFVLASRWRIGGAYLKQWGALTSDEHEKLRADAALMGIQIAPRDVHKFKWAVDGYQHKKRLGFDLAVEDIAWARVHWGEKFDAFAETQPPAWENVSPRALRLLHGQRRVMFFIYGFAGVVALMLAGEFLWFR